MDFCMHHGTDWQHLQAGWWTACLPADCLWPDRCLEHQVCYRPRSHWNLSPLFSFAVLVAVPYFFEQQNKRPTLRRQRQRLELTRVKFFYSYMIVNGLPKPSICPSAIII